MLHSPTKLRFLVGAVIVFILGQVSVHAAAADTIGQNQRFYVNSDFDISGRVSISATLEYVGAHAYFYVDDSYLNDISPYNHSVLDQQLATLAQEFDNVIYPKETGFWGSEANPGIDKDSRITILLERLSTGIGGYFDGANGFSPTQAVHTNQREMLATNIISVGPGQAKIFIAHELQHLISLNQKELIHNLPEDTWLNELRSQYAITIAGYNDNFQNSDLLQRVQTFINTPTDSLTEWPNTNLDYASVTLFGNYLVDRFGSSILADTLHSPLIGIDSINKYLSDHGTTERFVDIFADWEWANYLNSRATDPRFGYANTNLQYIHVPPTDSQQLSSAAPNQYSYSLKSWQPAWDLFRTDSSAVGKNLKISWQGSGFQVFYADSTGAEHSVGNGDIIAAPQGSFLLMPINSSQTNNFGSTETPSPLALSIEYTTKPLAVVTPAVHDGSLIMHAGTPDIYVVEGIYKRYLAPAVLPFYGLDPANAITVSEAVFQSYSPTNYIRDVNEKKVYAVWPDGTKHWLDITPQQFDASHRDWNSIFIVNDLESNFYKIGPAITQ